MRPLWVLIVSLFAVTTSAQDIRPPFSEFLADVRAEALSRGIGQATIDRALGALTQEPVVVARDRAQPEQTQSLDAYVARRLTPRTLTRGKEQLRTWQGVLTRVETEYGVPPPIMVAIWGLESSFGQFTGTYPTIKALATLAYDARRPLFRAELMHALAIVDRGVLAPEDLKGSWAGAMGQPQFMPSSFLAHAVDFDGDGRIDIWASVPDVLGSMASYLRSREPGWIAGERWGREVRITRAALAGIERDVVMRTSGCRAVRELTTPQPLLAWRKLGVTLPGGGALPTSTTMTASLVRGRDRHFLVYRNYEAILDYNCSNAYAVTVGLLADKIAR